MLSIDNLADCQDGAQGEIRVSMWRENETICNSENIQLIMNVMPKKQRIYQSNFSPIKTGLLKKPLMEVKNHFHLVKHAFR